MPSLPTVTPLCALLLCLLAAYLLIQSWVLQTSFDRACEGSSVARSFNACSFLGGLCVGVFAVWTCLQQRG